MKILYELISKNPLGYIRGNFRSDICGDELQGEFEESAYLQLVLVTECGTLETLTLDSKEMNDKKFIFSGRQVAINDFEHEGRNHHIMLYFDCSTEETGKFTFVREAESD